MNSFKYIGTRFSIEKLQLKDALSLNNMMLANQVRFKPFLPGTLAENLTIGDAKKYITKKNEEIEAKTNYTLAIKEPSKQQKVAGLIILKNIDWPSKRGEFAYGLGGEYSGNGWVSEAINQFKDYAIRDLGLLNFEIIAHAGNVGSIKVAENCGFIWTKTLLNAYKSLDGIPIDMEKYEYKFS